MFCDTIEKKEYIITENNKRFSMTLKKSLINKSYSKVMEMLKEEKHCPIKEITIIRSKNNWIKEMYISGCHSYMHLEFNKHTHRVEYVW